MHSRSLVFTFLLLVFLLLNAETILADCEIVRFVKENNVARKCCSLNKKRVDEKNVARFREQGYVVLVDGENVSVCRNIEDGEKYASRSGVDEAKKIPTFDVHQIVDSSERCPDDMVLDYQGNCVDAFK